MVQRFGAGRVHTLVHLPTLGWFTALDDRHVGSPSVSGPLLREATVGGPNAVRWWRAPSRADSAFYTHWGCA